jgi:hypothetical protein
VNYEISYFKNSIQKHNCLHEMLEWFCWEMSVFELVNIACPSLLPNVLWSKLQTVASCRVALHFVASRHLVLSRITSHRVASCRVALHCVASRHLASSRITSHRVASCRVASHYVASRRHKSSKWLVSSFM